LSWTLRRHQSRRRSPVAQLAQTSSGKLAWPQCTVRVPRDNCNCGSKLTRFELVCFIDERRESLFEAIVRDGAHIVRALRQGASNSVGQTGQQIVQRQLDIAPKLTIRPGFPIRVLVTRDLVLEPYGG
jgi:Bacterial conjugation TrbI-like protein